MKWVIYNILFFIAYLCMMPKFLVRMFRRGGYKNRFSDRFGFFPKEIVAKANDGHPRIWVHAVSVGEVFVAGQLMAEIRKQNPTISFLLSTTSSTGWTQAEKLIQDNDILIYNPLDAVGCIKRTLTVFHPIAYIITETEIWPNIIRIIHDRCLPIFLVNARISDHSAPGYKRLKCWFGPILNMINKIYAQSDLDVMRLMDAGCEAARIESTGSMKFDVAQRNPQKEEALKTYLTTLGFSEKSPILLGGSTWPGEDLFLLDVYRLALTKNPALRLIIVPRHFEKATDVESAIKSAGFPCVRKSRQPLPQKAPENAVLLADTTGELMGFYGISDVVFVGKSVCEHGAQNMIEPCLCGCATIVGPYTENFRPVMSDLLAQGAILQGNDRIDTKAKLLDILSSLENQEALRLKAKQAIAARRGLTPRIVADILSKI